MWNDNSILEGWAASFKLGAAVNRARSRSAAGTRSRKRDRSVKGQVEMTWKWMMSKSRRKCARKLAHYLGPHKEALPGEGFKDSAQKVKAMQISKNAVRQKNLDARKGEADRVLYHKKPKHLISGKRGTGKRTGGKSLDLFSVGKVCLGLVAVVLQTEYAFLM